MLDSVSHIPALVARDAPRTPEAVRGPAGAASPGAAGPGASRTADEVSISPQGLAAQRAGETPQAQPLDSTQLTEEEREQVRELQRRDTEVRAHEQAHLSAAGNLAAGGPSYETQRGPDGRQYAVGGEVNLRTSEGRTAEESLRIARQMQRAALAPAQPSAQDRAVAARAAQQAAEAQAEITAEREAEPSETAPGELEHREEAYARAGESTDASAGLLDSVVG
ncbi:MAG: hypothetical protein GY711_12050 [bacterium]|nr:hypothetical protein [bacterium]